MGKNDVEEIGLQFEELCSADDFNSVKGLNLFSFIFAALWSWELKATEEKVTEILRKVKQNNFDDFKDSGIKSIKARAKLLCGRNTLKEFVTIMLKLRRPGSSVYMNRVLNQKRRARTDPSGQDNDNDKTSSHMIAREELHQFWQRWFSLFETAEIYRDFENKILSHPDNPSEKVKARQTSARIDGILGGFKIDKEQRRHWHFDHVYAATQSIFCYNRTLFFDCDSGNSKMYSPLKSCPFQRNNHNMVEPLMDFYNKPESVKTKTKNKDPVQEARDKDDLIKEGERNKEKELRDRRTLVTEYHNENPHHSANPPHSASGGGSSNNFGAVRSSILERLGRKGVRFAGGSFLNRFGQPISADKAYRHYAT